jgi:hypothetical protein
MNVPKFKKIKNMLVNSKGICAFRYLSTWESNGIAKGTSHFWTKYLHSKLGAISNKRGVCDMPSL